MTSLLVPHLKAKIAEILKAPTDNIYLFYKGRVALYSLLKSAGVKPDDEVIIQGFTCIAVPNAIMMAGAKPIYADVSRETFNMTLKSARQKITSKTFAIIIQNTFGLTSHAQEFRDYCDKNGLLLIEDCTHGFGGTHDGLPNGRIAHSAFYSTQWSKPFTSGLGGFALINDLKRFPQKDFLNLPSPPTKKNLSLLLQNCIYSLIPSQSLLSRLKAVYHSFYSRGWISGSSTPEELLSPPKTQEEAWSLGPIQMMFALSRISGLKESQKLRAKIGQEINEILRLGGFRYYPQSSLRDHAFLRFPILCKATSRGEVLDYIRKKYGYVPGDWFTTPLYPVNEMSAWFYTPCENAETICAQIINLPTDRPSLVKKILNDSHVRQRLELDLE